MFDLWCLLFVSFVQIMFGVLRLAREKYPRILEVKRSHDVFNLLIFVALFMWAASALSSLPR